MNKDKQVKKETEWEKEQLEVLRMIKNYYLDYYLDQEKKLVEDDPMTRWMIRSRIEGEIKLIKELIYLRLTTMYRRFKNGEVYDEGVEQNYIEALKCYKLAADQGDDGAQHNLGLMYYNGKGVKQDYAEAIKYFQLAADQGYVRAQNNLGVMYYYGHGVKRDYVEAFKYFKLSANGGNVGAQFNLGNMYYNGQGVEQKYIEELEFFKLAADHDDHAVVQALSKMLDT